MTSLFQDENLRPHSKASELIMDRHEMHITLPFTDDRRCFLIAGCYPFQRCANAPLYIRVVHVGRSVTQTLYDLAGAPIDLLYMALLQVTESRQPIKPTPF